MAKTDTERKTAQRKRDRALGLFERVVLVHVDDVPKIRALELALRNARGFK